MITPPVIPISVLEERYAGLPPFPDLPVEGEWPDRRRTFQDFLFYGPISAELLTGGPGGKTQEVDRMRQLFPELFDLVLVAYPNDRVDHGLLD